MEYALTLIAAADNPVIDDALIMRLSTSLNSTKHDMLAPYEAVSFYCTGTEEHILSIAQDIIGERPLDIFCTPAQNRRKQLLVADMESTIIPQECLDELADMTGIGAQVTDITRRAMLGEIDFTHALRERVALLRDLPLTYLQKLYDEKVTLTPGAQTLIATMRAHNSHCALVSGGFAFFVQRIATRLNFHSFHCNELGVKDNRLDGTVPDPILDAQAKADILQKLCAELHISPADALAVGDGANDIAMVTQAGLGIAYHAKPALEAATPFRVTHSDLTALLYIQGYHMREFIL